MNVSQLNVNANIQVSNVGGNTSTSTAVQVNASMISHVGNGYNGADSIANSSVSVGALTQNVAGNAGLNAGVDSRVSLNAEQQSQLSGIAGQIRGGDVATASDKFAQFVGDIHANGMPVDVNALVQQVLRESYVDTTADLQFYADKVKYFNEAKKMTREYVQDLRDFKTGMSAELQKSGFCLSSPPSSNETFDKDTVINGKTYEAGSSKLDCFNELVSNYCSMNRAAAAHGATESGAILHDAVYQPVISMINDIARDQSINDVMARADKIVMDTFGCGLPDEIKNAITSALKDGSDDDINIAMRDMAGYISYLADSAVGNGKFHGHAGCDDVIHITSEPSYKDYNNYCTSSDNKTARGNLNSNDLQQIIKAFGFVDVDLSTRSSLIDVQNTAMSPLHDAWKNEVLIGVEETTDAICKDIKNNPDSQWVKDHPEVLKQVQDAYTEHQYESTNEMARDIGLPGGTPPNDCSTLDQLDNYIEKFEEKLNTLGDDSQLANTDLQNILQKQQQTLQMMSNISKTLSDTALAVIRKIG